MTRRGCVTWRRSVDGRIHGDECGAIQKRRPECPNTCEGADDPMKRSEDDDGPSPTKGTGSDDKDRGSGTR